VENCHFEEPESNFDIRMDVWKIGSKYEAAGDCGRCSVEYTICVTKELVNTSIFSSRPCMGLASGSLLFKFSI
jgi:hypothetical protein